LATGHGHLGLTDSLNTAQRISEALLGARRGIAADTPVLAGA
jgi:D-amino-acid dehydrogenase